VALQKPSGKRKGEESGFYDWNPTTGGSLVGGGITGHRTSADLEREICLSEKWGERRWSLKECFPRKRKASKGPGKIIPTKKQERRTNGVFQRDWGQKKTKNEQKQ